MIILDQEVLDEVTQRLRTCLPARSDPYSALFDERLAEEDAVSRTVWLHVYDLNNTTKFLLNHWIFSRLAGLGAFHCGVEVLGAEWSFQADPWCQDQGSDRTGLMCLSPKRHPVHIYRESLLLGTSAMSVYDIWQALLQLEQQWPANSYHTVKRNCTDFAEELVQALLVPEPFPKWVRGIAKGYLIHTPFATGMPMSEMPKSYTSRCGSDGGAMIPVFDAPLSARSWVVAEGDSNVVESCYDEGLNAEPDDHAMMVRKPDREETFMEGLQDVFSCVMRSKGDEEPLEADLAGLDQVDEWGDQLGHDEPSPSLACVPQSAPPRCEQGCYSFVCDIVSTLRRAVFNGHHL